MCNSIELQELYAYCFIYPDGSNDVGGQRGSLVYAVLSSLSFFLISMVILIFGHSFSYKPAVFL